MPTLSLAGEKPEKSGYSWKILIFGILGIILAFGLGFSAMKIFSGEPIVGFSAFWLLLILLVLFLVNFALESILAQSLRLSILFLDSLAIVAGFYLAKSSSFLIWELVWIAVFFVFFIYSRHLIQSSAEQMLKLKWMKMTKKGIGQALTVFLLFASISFGIFISQKPPNEFFISEGALGSFLNSGNFLARLYLENFNWNLKFGDFSKMIVEKTISGTLEKMLGKSLEGLPPNVIASQKQLLIEQNLPLFKEQISKAVGFSIKDNQTLVNVIHQFLFNKFQGLPPNIHQIIIAVLVVLLFFTLKTLSFIVSFIARAIGYLIYEAFLAAGFVHVIYEGRTKESVILP